MASSPDISWCKQGGSRGWIVVKQVNWEIGKKGSDWDFHVEVGREFESSVPWFLKWVLDPNDPYFLKAAAIHDKLIEEGYRRPFCDAEWLDATRSVKAPKLKRELGNIAMRLRLFFKHLMDNDQDT